LLKLPWQSDPSPSGSRCQLNAPKTMYALSPDAVVLPQRLSCSSFSLQLKSRIHRRFLELRSCRLRSLATIRSPRITAAFFWDLQLFLAHLSVASPTTAFVRTPRDSQRSLYYQASTVEAVTTSRTGVTFSTGMTNPKRNSYEIPTGAFDGDGVCIAVRYRDGIYSEFEIGGAVRQIMSPGAIAEETVKVYMIHPRSAVQFEGSTT